MRRERAHVPLYRDFRQSRVVSAHVATALFVGSDRQLVVEAMVMGGDHRHERGHRLLHVWFCLAVLTATMFASAPQRTLPKAAQQVNQVMQARAAAGDFSGALLVAHEGRILYEHAFGYADREWKIPNDFRTKFEIGSITKQFTSMLVLQFVK